MNSKQALIEALNKCVNEAFAVEDEKKLDGIHAAFDIVIDHLEDMCIGKGKHYIQEDQPDAIGKAIAQWIVKGD